MKKIIAAFDGLKFSESTKQYAIALSKLTKAHLVGIFLDDFTEHSYSIYDLINEGGGVSSRKQKRLETKDAETRSRAVSNFETACQNAKLEFSIHRDGDIAMQELLHESIYADLLIISQHETFTRYSEKPPTEFIRDMLVNVQCPVLVVPPKYKPIDSIVLLYDGEPSSVYAIKVMSNVLGNPGNLPVKALSVKKETQTRHVPDAKLMKEFMKRHFPVAHYLVLKGNPERMIVEHIKKMNASPIVVLGAYRRGLVSRWFRQSMADILMRELKLPLFITHH